MDRVLSHVPTKVTPTMNGVLKTSFTRDEVKKRIFQIFPTKAPGPDGYLAHIFQRHWDVCGVDVTKLMSLQRALMIYV
jgi:hypothetical protein